MHAANRIIGRKFARRRRDAARGGAVQRSTPAITGRSAISAPLLCRAVIFIAPVAASYW